MGSSLALRLMLTVSIVSASYSFGWQHQYPHLRFHKSQETLEKIQKQSDGVIYWKIANGRSPMPGYGSLTPTQRWDLVNYVRTLKKN